MATIACPSCAQPIDAAASYCPNCGNPVAASVERTTELPIAGATGPAASVPAPPAPSSTSPSTPSSGPAGGYPTRGSTQYPRPPRQPTPLEIFARDRDMRGGLLSTLGAGGFFFTWIVAFGLGTSITAHSGVYSNSPTRVLGIILSILFGIAGATGAYFGAESYVARRGTGRDGLGVGAVLIGLFAVLVNIALLISFIALNHVVGA